MKANFRSRDSENVLALKTAPVKNDDIYFVVIGCQCKSKYIKR